MRDHLIDDVSSVVVDIGSFHTRAGKFLHLIIIIGYSGEDCPRSVNPSIVGIAD